VEVQERLSAFFDGELPSPAQELVSEHIRSCVSCTEEFQRFEKLSQMASQLRRSEPPVGLWIELEKRLNAANVPSSTLRSRPLRTGLVATAALLLIGLAVGYYAQTTWFAHGHADHLGENFGLYLDEFTHDPARAQQTLIGNFDGKATSLKEIMLRVKYRPVVADGLPKGYKLDGMYLLKMPCCICPQAILKGNDGHVLAVFEHDGDEPTWFADRPKVQCRCAGRPTSVVEINGKLAASYKSGSRYVTLVGLRDLDETTRLIGQLTASQPVEN
jgi:hypothetical protein